MSSFKKAVGFEDPTKRYRERSINLSRLFVPNESAMRLITSTDTYQNFGIAKGDWLLLNKSLSPGPQDIVLFDYLGERGLAKANSLSARYNGDEDLLIIGVITLAVHHFRAPPPLPTHSDLTEIDFHSLLVTQEYSTLLCKASGHSMLPFLHNNDLIVLERHLEPTDSDVIIIALNNELVVKRINMSTKTLYSDNPKFKPIKLTQQDYTRFHGVCRASLRLLRPI
ncbi:umuD protein [Photobacterium angustum]|uniref:UmuD protein n=1 Tax=Photobacterium angustum TaxID=661 RepID=A0ABX5H154_PHOAN|nr:S24 family peptidase [Photobacterium angustum]KJG37757.1 umuD protein [Photobacterium angustum]PSX07024.1 umuD protein [Photobacterium angustum]